MRSTIPLYGMLLIRVTAIKNIVSQLTKILTYSTPDFMASHLVCKLTIFQILVKFENM